MPLTNRFEDNLILNYNTTWVSNSASLGGMNPYEMLMESGLLQVVTDRKVPFTVDGVLVYSADVVSYSDYSPYGMQMPGRHGTEGDYRYGFNGMEKDDEVAGNGNSYTTEFRQYDTRIGRWKSLDPLMAQNPGQSAYVAFNNNPIYFSDPTGLEGEPKAGDIRKNSEDATIQEVFNGTEWINTNSIENFQTSNGNIYIREGESGAHSYSMITTLMIDIDNADNLEASYGKGHNSFILGNTLIIPSTDIESVDALISTFIGDYKVNNLITKIQGGMSYNEIHNSWTGGLATSYNENGSTIMITSLKLYYVNMDKPGTSEEDKDAMAYERLLQRLNTGGLCIAGSCNIGIDSKFMERTRLWLPDVLGGYYVNSDLGSTRPYRYQNSPTPIKLVMSTDFEDFSKGWLMWGITNPNQVAKGKSAKYGSVGMGKSVPYSVISNEGFSFSIIPNAIKL
jgi:RHS repeat-associated protein